MITLTSCHGKNEKNSDSTNPFSKETIKGIPEFEFTEEMHNFGSLHSGEIIVCTFVFSNVGNGNLIINNVTADCGCVHAEFTKNPVAPGKTGLIEVEFDSSGLTGRQYKTIEIHANTKKSKQLAIFAEVQNEQIEIKY